MSLERRLDQEYVSMPPSCHFDPDEVVSVDRAPSHRKVLFVLFMARKRFFTGSRTFSLSRKGATQECSRRPHSQWHPWQLQAHVRLPHSFQVPAQRWLPPCAKRADHVVV